MIHLCRLLSSPRCTPTGALRQTLNCSFWPFFVGGLYFQYLQAANAHLDTPSSGGPKSKEARPVPEAP